MNQGVADPRLTTWLLRHEYELKHLLNYNKGFRMRQEKKRKKETVLVYDPDRECYNDNTG